MNNATALFDYYSKDLYPFALIHRLMTMNKRNQSGEARTVAIQWPGDPNVFTMYDYRRETAHALRNKMTASYHKVPESVHLGLFRENFGSKLVQSKKELVFDLDITDFTRYCACLQSKQLCSVCWIQMQGASLILDHILHHSLGYKPENRLWIFSGGKGLHCFVNASNALCLGDKERDQLHKRFFIGCDDDQRLGNFVSMMCAKYPDFVKRVELFFITHMIKEANIFALNYAEESFEAFCLRHLRTRHGPLEKLVKGIWSNYSSDRNNNNEDDSLPVKKQRTTSNISVKKWRALQELETLNESSSPYKPSLFIIFRLFYPMIDDGPLKIAHQIKLPFSVHSRTRNISLPLTQSAIMEMNLSRDTLALNDLWKASRQNQPLPACFNTGKELLEKWIEAYPL